MENPTPKLPLESLPAVLEKLPEGFELLEPRPTPALGLHIVCAAVLNTEGQILVGPRHFDETMTNALLLMKEPWKWHRSQLIEGFIDQTGAFHDRKAAWEIAYPAGQIHRRVPGDGRDGSGLLSENLY